MPPATILRSLSAAAEVIRAATAADRRLMVGITGCPGAGKSTVAQNLIELLSPRATLLPMDGFHLPLSKLVEFGRRERMGAPDTFDVAGFLATLAAIRTGFGNTGVSVHAPGFDRKSEAAVPDAIDVLPEVPCVIVEGNYLLLDSDGWEPTASLLDLTFFVEVDGALRLERLIERHERFGKSAAEARAWALGPDEDNARLIEATAARADYRIALG